MVVTVAFDGDLDDTMSFLLGSREAASGDIEVYSPQSPLGRAIVGQKVGTDVTYELPNGRKANVTIIEAKPYTG
jgi:transcription elongation factor GreA